MNQFISPPPPSEVGAVLLPHLTDDGSEAEWLAWGQPANKGWSPGHRPHSVAPKPTLLSPLLWLWLLQSHPDQSHLVFAQDTRLLLHGGICGCLCPEQTHRLALDLTAWSSHYRRDGLAIALPQCYLWLKKVPLSPNSLSIVWGEHNHNSSSDIICPFSPFPWQGARTPYYSVTLLSPPYRDQDPHCWSSSSSPLRTKQIPRTVSTPWFLCLSLPDLCLAQSQGSMDIHSSPPGSFWDTMGSSLAFRLVAYMDLCCLELPGEQRSDTVTQRLRERAQDLRSSGL